jgi:translation elongation factor EF-1alpha
MSDLDSAMDVINALEERRSREESGRSGSAKELVGTTEHYYKNIGVVAIRLEGNLKVGDIIEIGDEEEAVRLKVSSMQIDRKDVNWAHSGDSVGIKIRYPVADGSSVYRL